MKKGAGVVRDSGWKHAVWFNQRDELQRARDAGFMDLTPWIEHQREHRKSKLRLSRMAQ